MISVRVREGRGGIGMRRNKCGGAKTAGRSERDHKEYRYGWEAEIWRNTRAGCFKEDKTELTFHKYCHNNKQDNVEPKYSTAQINGINER